MAIGQSLVCSDLRELAAERWDRLTQSILKTCYWSRHGLGNLTKSMNTLPKDVGAIYDEAPAALFRLRQIVVALEKIIQQINKQFEVDVFTGF